MRYIVVALMSAASSYGALTLQSSCSVPWATFPDVFQGYPAGVRVPGTGGADSAVLNGPGSAQVSCASAYPGNTVVPTSAQIQVGAGGFSAAAPIVNVLTNPYYDGATDYSGAFVQSSISGFLSGQTAGPLRPGLLYLTGSGRVWSSARWADNPTITVAGQNVTLTDPAEQTPPTLGPFPVTLGVPFTITLDGFNGFVRFRPEEQAMYADVRWRFTELNGTQVDAAILLTPEPSTFLPGAAALFAGAMFAAARRTRRAS